jgi:predicted Zn finger-like uncharacterized protein
VASVMIIECPVCGTKYDVKVKWPPAGRSVRCAKCQNVWRAVRPIEGPDASIEEARTAVRSVFANLSSERPPAGEQIFEPSLSSLVEHGTEPGVPGASWGYVQRTPAESKEQQTPVTDLDEFDEDFFADEDDFEEDHAARRRVRPF